MSNPAVPLSTDQCFVFICHWHQAGAGRVINTHMRLRDKPLLQSLCTLSSSLCLSWVLGNRATECVKIQRHDSFAESFLVRTYFEESRREKKFFADLSKRQDFQGASLTKPLLFVFSRNLFYSSPLGTVFFHLFKQPRHHLDRHCRVRGKAPSSVSIYWPLSLLVSTLEGSSLGPFVPGLPDLGCLLTKSLNRQSHTLFVTWFGQLSCFPSPLVSLSVSQIALFPTPFVFIRSLSQYLFVISPKFLSLCYSGLCKI